MWRAAVHEKASQMMVEAVQGALPRKAALDVRPPALCQGLRSMRPVCQSAWLRVYVLSGAWPPAAAVVPPQTPLHGRGRLCRLDLYSTID